MSLLLIQWILYLSSLLHCPRQPVLSMPCAQWKESIITPVPKVTQPQTCGDFRPISITTILSRTLEKIVTRKFMSPVLNHPSVHNQFEDQFAFRPTGSTTSALIHLTHRISEILNIHPYVHLIAIDFSKAFDTVSHSALTLSWRLFLCPTRSTTEQLIFLMEGAPALSTMRKSLYLQRSTLALCRALVSVPFCTC